MIAGINPKENMKTQAELYQMAEELYYGAKGTRLFGYKTLREWIIFVEITFGEPNG